MWYWAVGHPQRAGDLVKPITRETATASRPYKITDGGTPSKIMEEMLLEVVDREGIPVLTVDWICPFTMQPCIR